MVGIAVGALFPISLRSFSREAVASMFFIDLVGCALAPILFWLMMSAQGVPLVTAVSVVLYGALGGILAWRKWRGPAQPARTWPKAWTIAARGRSDAPRVRS